MNLQLQGKGIVITGGSRDIGCAPCVPILLEQRAALEHALYKTTIDLKRRSSDISRLLRSQERHEPERSCTALCCTQKLCKGRASVSTGSNYP